MRLSFISLYHWQPSKRWSEEARQLAVEHWRDYDLQDGPTTRTITRADSEAVIRCSVEGEVRTIVYYRVRMLMRLDQVG